MNYTIKCPLIGVVEMHWKGSYLHIFCILELYFFPNWNCSINQSINTYAWTPAVFAGPNQTRSFISKSNTMTLGCLFSWRLLHSCKEGAPQAKISQTFSACNPWFFAILYVFSQLGKIWKLFTDWGKNMHFPLFFCPLLIIFFIVW